jgi:hypothetical protein
MKKAKLLETLKLAYNMLAGSPKINHRRLAIAEIKQVIAEAEKCK